MKTPANTKSAVATTKSGAMFSFSTVAGAPKAEQNNDLENVAKVAADYFTAIYERQNTKDALAALSKAASKLNKAGFKLQGAPHFTRLNLAPIVEPELAKRGFKG